MSERAAIVVPLPLSVVESSVADVTSWVAFLGDVEWIERSAPERYVFGLRQGRRVHDVPMTVRWYRDEHRVVWRETSGPVWRGEIRLTALNGRRTRVALEVTAQPRSLGAGLAGVFRRDHRQADLDLGRLAACLAAVPQPFNPARLDAEGRVPGGRGGVRAARKEEYLASHGGGLPDDLGAYDDVEILEAGAL